MISTKRLVNPEIHIRSVSKGVIESKTLHVFGPKFHVFPIPLVTHKRNASATRHDRKPFGGRHYYWWLVRVTLAVGLVFLPQHFGSVV